jgi:hypothetical protein
MQLSYGIIIIPLTSIVQHVSSVMSLIIITELHLVGDLLLVKLPLLAAQLPRTQFSSSSQRKPEITNMAACFDQLNGYFGASDC